MNTPESNPLLPTAPRRALRDVPASPSRLAEPRREAAGSEDGESLIDLGLIRDLGQFAINACKRRRPLVLLVFGAFLIVGVLSALLLPRKYYVETKLLADRNVVMPLLGNPSRRLPNEADTPTRLAAEVILNHENLASLVTTADLLVENDRRRPWLSKVKRQVRAMMSRPLTRDEQVEEIIWTLRSHLNVQVGDGTVTIGVVWNDPNLAFRIVQIAQQNFLEERQTQELALISGSISILEKTAAEVGVDITTALDSLSRERVAMTPAEARPLLANSRRTRPNLEALAAQSTLDGILRSIADLEQFRNRRVAELQSTLIEQRNTYGAAHPAIENTQQMIRAMQGDSPQLAQLRRDEQTARADVSRLGGVVGPAVGSNGDQMLAAAAIRSLEGMRSDSVIQEKQQYGRSRLRIAISSYQGLLERLEDARMELQTVRATFKFKYGVLIPAQIPRETIGLKPAVIIAASLVLGLLMAVFTAVALDLVGARVLEPWQIERSIGLPVLGSAPVPSLRQ